jgi:hypothetical protein
MDGFASAMDFDGLVIDDPVVSTTRATLAPLPPPSTGTSDMLFSSPTSLASGSTGGGKVGNTLGLVYIEDASDFCCGVIQGSDRRRFCIKLVGSCVTKGHKTKVNVPGKTLYIKQARRGQARLEPSLSVGLRPTELSMNELLSKEHAFEVWVAYFENLKATKLGGTNNEFGSPDSWEDVEPPSLASLSRARETFKTPKKLKLGPLLAPELVPVWILTTPRPTLTKVEAVGEEIGEELQLVMEFGIWAILADWNKLEANFEFIRLESEAGSRGET